MLEALVRVEDDVSQLADLTRGRLRQKREQLEQCFGWRKTIRAGGSCAI